MADADEELLLTLLNSTPVVRGVPVDRFDDTEAARAQLAAVGPTLQAVIRGRMPADALAADLRDVASVPTVSDGRLRWRLHTASDRELVVRAILAWDRLAGSEPSRVRPCANPDCRRFLIDHSTANSARWCSMAVCGNRMKARRHYDRVRGDAAS